MFVSIRKKYPFQQFFKYDAAKQNGSFGYEMRDNEGDNILK